jgi:pectin methylesterase-like acyl-CoA thioesterase
MQKTCCRSGIALLITSFVTVAVDAAVLNVPANYPTIQRAIDVSASGDLILVSPGVYNESLNFRRKAVTLSSTNPADLNVVRSTVIRAVGKRSAVSFITGETSNSILSGFTISGGYGTVNANFGTDTYWGAGIYCYRSSPTIVGNIITENFAPNGDTNIFG